jgi:hypothetical protein
MMIVTVSTLLVIKVNHTRAKCINLRSDLLDDIQETSLQSSIAAEFAKRAKRTAEFAAAKNIDGRGVGWREKLDALFLRGTRIPKEDKVALRVARPGCGIAKKNVTGLRSTSWVGLSPAAPGSSHCARSDMVGDGGSEADTVSLYSQVTVCRHGRPYHENP